MNKFTKYFSGILALAVLGAGLFGATHSRQILDYAALYNYQPSPEIVKIADSDTMNDKTRRVFYVNHPELQDKNSFKNSCVNQEKTIVLGCYVQNTGIYVLKVDDPRLNGIIEVTSAHEVLHAMYDRLSSDERAKVDAMTAKYFEGLKDERIRANIENYRSRDPAVVPNELHSILGTEVRDLSPELETYYSRYFNDRKQVVSFSEKYEQTFVDLENQAKTYKTQLDNLKKSLDANEQQVNALGAQVDQDRKRLDSLYNAGKFEEYNASVAGFNSLVDQYNGLIRSRKAMISQYNEIVGLYNGVAGTEAELVQKLQVTEVKTQQSR
jgi:hypothetical protein